MQRLRAIAHDQILSIGGYPPALGLVAELPNPGQVFFVPDQADARPPGELDEPVLPGGNALAEESAGQACLLQNMARLQIDPAKT